MKEMTSGLVESELLSAWDTASWLSTGVKGDNFFPLSFSLSLSLKALRVTVMNKESILEYVVLKCLVHAKRKFTTWK